MISYYELLGVPPDAADAEIKSAYRAASLICHPDRVGPDGNNLMRLLNEAYHAIGTAQARADYARLTAAAHPQPEPQPEFAWQPTKRGGYACQYETWQCSIIGSGWRYGYGVHDGGDQVLIPWQWEDQNGNHFSTWQEAAACQKALQDLPKTPYPPASNAPGCPGYTALPRTPGITPNIPHWFCRRCRPGIPELPGPGLFRPRQRIAGLAGAVTAPAEPAL